MVKLINIGSHWDHHLEIQNSNVLIICMQVRHEMTVNYAVSAVSGKKFR